MKKTTVKTFLFSTVVGLVKSAMIVTFFLAIFYGFGRVATLGYFVTLKQMNIVKECPILPEVNPNGN